jgi:hypothetical protein
MGIEGSWKNLLRKDFPKAFLECIPNGEIPDVIIEDMSITVRSMAEDIRNMTGAHIAEKLTSRINFQCVKGKTKQYVALFDNHDRVPRSKGPKQRSRRALEASSGYIPYTEEELAKNGSTLQITTGKLPPMKRVLATPKLRGDYYRFCTDCICNNIGLGQTTDVIIDAGRTKPNQQQKPLETIPVYLVCRAGKIVEIREPDKDGEADVKMAKYVFANKGKTVMVKTKDSDSIPILLLNVRTLIDASSKYVGTKVYIDMRDCGGEEKRHIVDVIELWRSIMERFHRNPVSKSIYHPIETVVVMILTTGCDYIIKRFATLGPTKIWQYFIENGRDILVHQCGAVIRTQCPIGTNKRQSIQLAENLFYDFISMCYCREVGLNFFSLNEERLRGTDIMTHVCNYAQSNGRKTKYIPYSRDYVVAVFRRIRWCLEYWSNASLGERPDDPLDTDEITHYSKHGWYEQEGEVYESDVVFQII